MVLDFEYTVYNEDKQCTETFWVETEEFVPASPATQFEEPSDNIWTFRVYDVDGNLTEDYHYQDLVEEAEAQYALEVYERERDQAEMNELY